MDSKKESEFLSSECRRLTEKIKAAQAKGRLGGIVKHGEKLKVRQALEKED